MPTLFDSHAEFDEWFSKDIENSVEKKSSIDQRKYTFSYHGSLELLYNTTFSV